MTLHFIHEARAPARQSIDDATRDAWVQDHAGWYAALCRSGLPRMAFVRLHAADIDADIRVASQARGRRMGSG